MTDRERALRKFRRQKNQYDFNQNPNQIWATMHRACADWQVSWGELTRGGRGPTCAVVQGARLAVMRECFFANLQPNQVALHMGLTVRAVNRYYADFRRRFGKVAA